MLINGKEILLDKPTSAGTYIDENGYRRSQVAIELNGCILPKADYDTVILNNADKIEIVCFVGGG